MLGWLTAAASTQPLYASSTMITLSVHKQDDPQFIALASNILNACIDRYHPGDIYVVAIDHAFDRKWQRFSGKVLGALGTWNRRLVIPPFDPQRVVSQCFYRLHSSGGYQLASARPLHIEQSSGHNTSRWLSQVSESGLFIWYSSGTTNTNQASVLLYQIDDTGTSDWFASFTRNGEWKLNRVCDISRRVLEDMINLPRRSAYNKSLDRSAN